MAEDKFLSHLGVIMEVTNDVGICYVRPILSILTIGREASVSNLLRFCFIRLHVTVLATVWSASILLL